MRAESDAEHDLIQSMTAQEVFYYLEARQRKQLSSAEALEYVKRRKQSPLWIEMIRLLVKKWSFETIHALRRLLPHPRP
jgi:Holliday junction resolvase-like predicted endonuclease